jgi:Flp pilus assembly pilin Flp
MSATPNRVFDNTGAASEPLGLAEQERPQLHQISVGRANATTIQYCLIGVLMTIAALSIFAPIGNSVSSIFAKVYSALGGT